jgi:hypothetical protein
MMPLWLLSNWRLVLGGIAVAAMLGWGTVGWWKYSSEHGARLEERQAAAEYALKAEKDARAKDNANAAIAAELDAARAKAAADIDAGRADFDRRLRDARQARRNCVSAPADNSGQPADPATGGNGADRTDDPGHRLRDVGLKLQADVAECWAWAAKVGRQ